MRRARDAIGSKRHPLTAALAAVLLGAPVHAPTRTFATDVAVGDPARPLEISAAHSRARYADARVPDGARVAVTNCDDDGAGSLRDVVRHVGAGALVDMTHLPCSTITLTSGAIVATHALSLAGPAREALAIDGNGGDRVIEQSGGGLLYVSGVTIRNGVADGNGGCIETDGDALLVEVAMYGCAAAQSGGALSAASGDLRVADSRITGNSAGAAMPGGGGALYARSVAILRSIVSGNDAPIGAGGAILTRAGHPPNYYRNLYESALYGNHAHVGGAVFSRANSFYDFESMSSTVSGNSADRAGGIAAASGLYLSSSTIAYNTETGGAAGGIYLYSSGALLLSSIVSGNMSASAPLDIAGVSGARLYGDHDLIGTSPLTLPYQSISAPPLLGPLSDNGGPTPTHALLPGSPAIHAGSYGLSVYDQRGPGYTRHVGGAFDIGAFTVQSTGVVRTVVNCDDSGAGSLRDAINQSSSGDTIDLSALACGTITLTSDALNRFSEGNLTLIGPGRDALTLDGNDQFTPLYGAVRGRLTISGLTIAHGLGVNGGCINSYGTLVLIDAAVRACTAGYLGGGGVLANRVFMTRTIVADNTATATVRRTDGGGVFAQSELEMHDSTVSGNRAAGAYDYSLGGGVVVSQARRVLIEGSTISGNSAGDEAGGINGYGAGIGIRGFTGFASRHVVIRNSTISGNHAASAVGGISSEASMRLDNSTVAFNTAVNEGPSSDLAAGVNMIFRYYDGALDLDSSIVASNFATEPTDLSGHEATVFGSHDLVMVSSLGVPGDTIAADPLLAALADNGGATMTHALMAASPALDAGSNAENLPFDQRGDGFPRVFGVAADIGAYEAQAVQDAIFVDGFDG